MSKKISLICLTVQNFLSFEDEQKIHFKNKGIHIISGENQDMSLDTFADEVKQTNSAGKSSIFKGVDFALFGESPNKKIKNDALINKNVKKNLKVTLEFSVNSKLYKIERYRKLNGKGNGVNFFEMQEGSWNDISFADIKLTQEKIESIIEMNHDTFLYSVLLTRESSVLSFIELPWYQRSVFLENIVRLDKLREYTKRVKEKLSEDRKNCDFLSREIYAIDSTVSSLKSLNKKLIASKKKDRNERKNKIDSLREELNVLLSNTDVHLVESFIEYTKSFNEEQSYKKNITKSKNDLKNLLNRLNQSKASLLKTLYKLDQAKIPKIESCSICQKEIERRSSDEVLNTLQHSIDETKASIKNQKETIKLQVNKTKEELNIYKNKLEKLSLYNKENYSSMNKSLKKKIIDDVFSGGDGKKDLGNMNLIKDEISKLEDFKIHFEDIKHNRSELLSKKTKQSELKSRLEETKKRVSLGEFWDAALDFRNEGSLKNYIMGKIVPVFNSFLSSMIDIIFEGKMNITFDSSWNETIIYNGEEYDYNQLSLGEKAKINLCISLSIFSLLRINIGGTDVIFFDEVFSSMDAASCEKFIKIFEDSYSKEMGLYIIHHSHGLKNFIPNSNICVVKKEGKSTIYS